MTLHLMYTLQFNGPFRIITTLGSRLILPASYIEWLKNFPDLDHQALVHDVAAPFTNAGWELTTHDFI